MKTVLPPEISGGYVARTVEVIGLMGLNDVAFKYLSIRYVETSSNTGNCSVQLDVARQGDVRRFCLEQSHLFKVLSITA